MNIVRTYYQYINGCLKDHYGADAYQLTRVRHSILGQHLGLILCLIFGALAWCFMPNELYRISALAIAVSGVVLSGVTIGLSCIGLSRLAGYLSIGFVALIFFSGICISGGIPYSISSHFIVLLPITMLRLMGTRSGLIAAITFPLIGIGLWFIQHHLGLFSIPYPYDSPPLMASMTMWLVGYFLIFTYFFVEHRQARKVEDQLFEEREKFAELAVTDNLTQLCNGRKFIAELDALIDQSTHTDEPFQIAYLDLNHFKHVNDTHGHEAGDEVLKIVARRLQKCVRDMDVLARLGGDEFVLILGGGLSETETFDILSRIEAKIAKPISHEMHMLHVTASIGLARFPDDGRTRRDLMNVADAHMYVDKSQKKATEQKKPHAVSIAASNSVASKTLPH